MYRQYINLMGAGGGASTLWNGLQAYYTADNNPNDVLSNTNGTLVNGATYGTGIINQGFSLDGANDYVDLGDNFDIGLESWSYNFWVNMDTINRSNSILTKSDSANNWQRWWFRVNPSNKLEFHLQNGTNNVTNRKFFKSTQSLNASTWYMVTVVLDRTDKCYMYINGVPETIVSTDGNGTSITNDLLAWNAFNFNTGFNSCIGNFSTANMPFDGIIDEGAIWNRVLTPSEVTELYNGGAGEQYPTGIDAFWNGTLSYLKADNTTYDEVTGYNGILNNGATYDTGVINQSFSFDRSLTQSITTTSTPHNYATETTYNMWVKPSSLPGFCMFLYIPTGISGPGIGLRTGGNLTMFRGSVNADAKSGVNLVTDVWQMVTIVYRPWAGYGTNNVDFYINGSLVASKPLSVAGVGGSPMYVGSNGASNGAYDGFIDEISIWDSALTSTKITELYNLGAGKQYPL